MLKLIFSNVIASIPIAVVLMSGGCNHNDSHSQSATVNEVINSDSIPDPVKKLVTAIDNDDSIGFSKIVSYPIQRPYPLHDIENSKSMTGYYSTLIDDSLKNVVKNASVRDWNENGWRGWTVKDGNYIWVADSVYDIPYISTREKQRRDSLIACDMQSLPENLRKGWKPVACLQQCDDSTVYRIDILELNNPKPYRLAVYNHGRNLHGLPSKILRGKREQDGTAEITSYIFINGGEQTIFSPDVPNDNGELEILTIDKDNRQSSKPVRKVYWLQLLNK